MSTPPDHLPPNNPHQPNQPSGYNQSSPSPVYRQSFQQGGQPYGGGPQYGGPPQRPPRSKLPWILGGLVGVLGVIVLGLLAFIVLQHVGSTVPSPSTVALGSASATASPSASPAVPNSVAASSPASSSATASGSTTASGSVAASAASSPSASGAASPSASGGTGAVKSVQDVKKATVQIVAKGTFREPKQQVTNAFGSGTGFIIDSSGLAVTNNHVVTGAGTLDVFVAGEKQPRSARVVAASECNDLALIKIDGDNYPYLEWSQAQLDPTVEVYATGFPLGEPTYAATRGSINKVQSDVATPWALVGNEIVHDANLNPGNSGGPLVDNDGKVVGVNYAVDKESRQNFAIARDEARRVIDELKNGTDVRSIGINGTALKVDDSLSGIWVASVKSGSPADKARIRPGDFITHLEGIQLATESTMLDYCKVLRGHKPSDTLSVQVLRVDDNKAYEGQINGRELAETTSFAQLGASSGQQSTTAYSAYRTVQDNTHTIQVDIPNEWSDVDGQIWEVDGKPLGVQIQAAPNLKRFNDTDTEPGMVFVASRSVAQKYNENDLLQLFDLSKDCTKTESAKPFKTSSYTGLYDVYTKCGGKTTEAVVLTFVPPTRAYVGLVAIQLTSEADYEALDKIIASFQVIGTFKD